MKPKFSIPAYSSLTPKSRQRVNMIGGAFVCISVLLVVSGMLNGPEKIKGPAQTRDGPKPHPMAQVPGDALDARDVWVGSAQKEVAQLHEDLRNEAGQTRQHLSDQDRVNKQLFDELQALRQARTGGAAVAGALIPSSTASTAGTAASGKADVPAAMSANGILPPLPGAGNPQGGVTFPPGAPTRGLATSVEPSLAPPPTLVHVSFKTDAQAKSDAPSSGPNTTGSRRVDSYLPVGFIHATILGGLTAPTGGQAQTNPVPAIFRLADAAILPNHFRAQVRDCLVIGEGYGDQSSERAYIRTTTLSCVLKDGHVLEVPLKGQVFGEDGMNGVMGKLVTKQGQMLTNALLSGIASGLGQGLVTATTTTATSPLGTVTSTPNDWSSILQAGAGAGVAKALDRLSQYYISLAEKTFPVIEVLPGRTVDIVVTQGVALDASLAVGTSAETAERAGTDHAVLMESLVSAP